MTTLAGSPMECKHAALRRIVYGSGVHTKAPKFTECSSKLCVATFTNREPMQTEIEKFSSGNVRDGGDEDSTSGRRRPNPWNLFMRRERLCGEGLGDSSTIATRYKTLEQEERNMLSEDCAIAAANKDHDVRGSASSAFGTAEPPAEVEPVVRVVERS